ncbi:hypothetical protein HQ560_19235 [bacterium]|nr:hypothetical protein [bacterium]
MSPSQPASTPRDSSRPARVVRAEGLSPDDVRVLLAAHHAALASGAGVLKDDRRTAVTRVPHGDGALCVKEFRRGGGLDALKDLLRRSRARRAWAGSRLLADRGVASPDALALAVAGESSYVITRFVVEAAPLDRLIAERFAFTPEPAAKHALLRQLGVWLRGVHERGIYHDDWSPKNILAAEGPAAWRFWFLDTESISARKGLNERRRAKNLAQLSDAPYGVTAADRVRLLVAYADGADPRRLVRSALPFAQRRERAWVRLHARALKSKERAR